MAEVIIHKENTMLSILERELKETEDLLLALECGEKNPEELPIAPKFYMTKKERLENLIWVYKVEERTKNNRVENASN